MSYVYGLVIVYGLLTWLLLVCESREEAERDQASEAVADEAEAVR
ncbi:membrane protein [Mycobacterium phage NothingSpecial]|nr:membrane protein [Mycobacterium phage NothingSpecial]